MAERRFPRRLLVAAPVILITGAAACASRPARRAPLLGHARAQVDRYALRSSLLGRALHEIAVTPPGGGSRPLLVFLHGRHDRRIRLASWLWPHTTGPDSVLTDALLEALASLGRRAPVVVLLDGGDSFYHDRRAGIASSGISEPHGPTGR